MHCTQLVRVLCSVVIMSYVAVCVLGDMACNMCQSNNVKCLNETHFTLCGNSVLPNQVLKCPADQICTTLQKICWPKGSFPAACTPDAEVSCPACKEPNMFVCTSRTTFQMCDGDKLTGQVIKCKDNTFCSMSSNKLCVERCEIMNSKNGFECDREYPLDV